MGGEGGGRGEDGGRTGGGREEDEAAGGYRTKNKNPTRQCGEKCKKCPHVVEVIGILTGQLSTFHSFYFPYL